MDSTSDVLGAWGSGVLIVTEQLDSLEILASNDWWTQVPSGSRKSCGWFATATSPLPFLHVKKFSAKLDKSFKSTLQINSGVHIILYLEYQEKELPIQEGIISVSVCVRPRRICELRAHEKPASANSAACETVCFNYATVSTHQNNFLVLLGLINIERYLSKYINSLTVCLVIALY